MKPLADCGYCSCTLSHAILLRGQNNLCPECVQTGTHFNVLANCIYPLPAWVTGEMRYIPTDTMPDKWHHNQCIHNITTLYSHLPCLHLHPVLTKWTFQDACLSSQRILGASSKRRLISLCAYSTGIRVYGQVPLSIAYVDSGKKGYHCLRRKMTLRQLYYTM